MNSLASGRSSGSPGRPWRGRRTPPAEVAAHRVAALLTRLTERSKAGRIETYRKALQGGVGQVRTSSTSPRPSPRWLANGGSRPTRSSSRPRRRPSGVRTRRRGPGLVTRAARERRPDDRPTGTGTASPWAATTAPGRSPSSAPTAKGGLAGKDLGRIEILATSASWTSTRAERRGVPTDRWRQGGGRPLRLRARPRAAGRAAPLGRPTGRAPTSGAPRLASARSARWASSWRWRSSTHAKRSSWSRSLGVDEPAPARVATADLLDPEHLGREVIRRRGASSRTRQRVCGSTSSATSTRSPCADRSIAVRSSGGSIGSSPSGPSRSASARTTGRSGPAGPNAAGGRPAAGACAGAPASPPRSPRCPGR